MSPEQRSLKSTPPDWTSPAPCPSGPAPQTQGPRPPCSSSPGSLPGAAKGLGSPGPLWDVLEAGEGPRGARTSTHQGALGPLGMLHGGRAWGSCGLPPSQRSPMTEGTWKGAVAASWPNVLPGGGQGCAQHPPQGHKQLKGLWEHGPGITHPAWQGGMG